MKKSFFYGALAVLSLAACSQNEVLDINRNGDEIKFNVVTNKATRAADIWSNTDQPGTFKVWANFTAGTPYFAGDDVTWDKNNHIGTSTNNRYWPDTDVNGTLDFFAIAGCNANLSIAPATTGATSTLNTASFTYEVQDGAVDATDNNYMKMKAQEDVLYAAQLQTSKPTDGGKVTLNFAHALSQIVFNAKVSNPKLHVVVSGVKVAHVKNSGTFTFSEDTDNNWTNSDDETGSVNDPYKETNKNNKGAWSNLSGDETYEITFGDVTLDNTAKALGGTEDYYMLLLPTMNATTAWSNSGGTSNDGTFFAVKCAIFNKATSDYVSTDIALWGSTTEEKYVFIPASINWQPGKKYIYTFDFGNGNGGYESDPNDPNEPDPTNPVLIPITYNITVDDFDIVSDTQVDVNGK